MTDVPQLFRVTLQVNDLEHAARFYSELLGIAGRSIRGSRVYFDCGPVTLALLAPGEGAASPNSDDLYFAVRELEAVHARASALNCLAPGMVHDQTAREIAKRPWGERSFYVVDPDGNELCFVEAGSEFTGRR